ncbi:2TM domain-containing protein [Antarcticibacterium sp. 1MA-6-2]|uniref:2TM domain-containing protein n=1 Tax=Antarcticibacterium sp. 1MA-6-2 TaxID=2908210 RepID=UPI001F437A78|nr:2TM domain-containing protein [Antarcticibacterium sp. 1MA-6-2]UJH92013.1 2TM domain-containing protein [Antarcticibacterium sp. 1MA-6-2]
MENRYIENNRYKAAQKRVKEIKGFYVHLLVYILVNLFIILGGSWDESFSSRFLDLENYITAFLWGIGLLAHWAGVFGT